MRHWNCRALHVSRRLRWHDAGLVPVPLLVHVLLVVALRLNLLTQLHNTWDLDNGVLEDTRLLFAHAAPVQLRHENLDRKRNCNEFMLRAAGRTARETRR